MGALVAEDPLLTQGAVLDGLDWGFAPSPLGLILSNVCDFENDNIGFVVVAALVPARGVIQASPEFQHLVSEGDTQLSKGKWAKLKKLLTAFIHNRDIRRYYLVHADCLDLDDLFVDLQHLRSFTMKKAKEAAVVARLLPPDREKLARHFVSYVGRIGVDRVDEQRTLEVCQRLADPYREG